MSLLFINNCSTFLNLISLVSGFWDHTRSRSLISSIGTNPFSVDTKVPATKQTELILFLTFLLPFLLFFALILVFFFLNTLVAFLRTFLLAFLVIDLFFLTTP